jgi:hypothetical protein
MSVSVVDAEDTVIQGRWFGGLRLRDMKFFFKDEVARGPMTL